MGWQGEGLCGGTYFGIALGRGNALDRPWSECVADHVDFLVRLELVDVIFPIVAHDPNRHGCLLRMVDGARAERSESRWCGLEEGGKESCVYLTGQVVCERIVDLDFQKVEQFNLAKSFVA